MGIKQLTESLLTLARSDSGQETAVCAPVDLSFIVNSSLMTFEPLVFDMDKHIIYDIEASLHVNGAGTTSGRTGKMDTETIPKHNNLSGYSLPCP